MTLKQIDMKLTLVLPLIKVKFMIYHQIKLLRARDDPIFLNPLREDNIRSNKFDISGLCFMFRFTNFDMTMVLFVQ